MEVTISMGKPADLQSIVVSTLTKNDIKKQKTNAHFPIQFELSSLKPGRKLISKTQKNVKPKKNDIRNKTILEKTAENYDIKEELKQ